MKGTLRRIAALSAGTLLVLGALAACGERSDDGGGGGGGDTITIGYIPWDENIVVTYLWKHVLEEAGHEVEVQQLDVAPTFVGLSDGTIDLFLDTWLPVTHADYWEEYGEQLEDLGVWYDNALLTIAVPEYWDEVNTIGDLAEHADEVDSTIVGIESGAGLTRVTRDEAMPTYGLEDFELQTSSTQAMLAALQQATDNEEPIVVTLWRPHWAYDAYPIKDLEDPEGAMGGAEEIHAVARTGFSDDFPEIAEAIGEFTMDDEMLAALEYVALQEHDDAEEGVAAWIADNAEWVDGLMN